MIDNTAYRSCHVPSATPSCGIDTSTAHINECLAMLPRALHTHCTVAVVTRQSALKNSIMLEIIYLCSVEHGLWEQSVLVFGLPIFFSNDF